MPDPGICQDGPLREPRGKRAAAEQMQSTLPDRPRREIPPRPKTQRTLSKILESPMKVFTTGQVAKICKVAPRTVSKWFDSGRLKGYRIPGSQDRRIPREYLIKFLKEHGMPLGDLEDEAMAKVLIVARTNVIENMKRELPVERAFRTTTAASGFEAGIQAESFHPDCIIVDFSIGQLEALQICQNLCRNGVWRDDLDRLATR